MLEFTNFVNVYLWGTPLIILVVGLALFYTIVLRVPQIRLFKDMVKSLSRSQASQSGITPFQSFAMALGGRIGIGSIAGVATAIAVGGPGAVFWMWVYAILGSALALVESSLAQLWKQKIAGEYRGGPSYYLTKTPLPWLGFYTAVAGILGYGFTGPIVQAFNISDSFYNAFNIPQLVTGIVVAVLFGVVVIGGMKRIASIAGYVVPFMAIVYLVITIIVLLVNITKIPAMFGLIFGSAFSLNAVFGGIAGSAIMWGVKRAIYSSEAGMGTGANAAASAEVSHPVKQGLAQGFSVYHTLIVCTCTALMILVTGMYNVYNESAGYAPIVENVPNIQIGIGYVQASIDTVAAGTGIGSVFIALAIFFFAITTLLSFGFYASVGLAMLFKKSKWLNPVIWAVTVLQMASIILGSIWSSELAWAMADLGVGMATWINLLGLCCLAPPMIKLMRDYDKQKKQGLDPVFDPANVDVKGAELWSEIVEENYKDLKNKNAKALGKGTLEKTK
ncbi:MAG: alanine:cation symporter family protein [Clostridiales bacterium]|jgi:AGCS family alanine or glycine:cation symporter|nr:alanine:cation symporter family protein [Clostridiales bacterium]